MSGTLAPIRGETVETNEPRRTISGERRIELPRSETVPIDDRVTIPAAEPVPNVAAEPRELLRETDLDGFVDTALDEHPVVPISEGTVQIRKFESPLLKPVPAARPPAQAVAKPPSWLLSLVDVVPAQCEKPVVAAILFFFLLGVLSFIGGVTILLFAL